MKEYYHLKKLEKMERKYTKEKSEKLNISKIKSKIKEKVENDKQNFKEKRKEADEYYRSLGFKNYEDWVNYNDRKQQSDDEQDKDFIKYKKYHGPTIVKKNFLISYDKNLQPADVKESLKEIPIKKAKAMKLLNSYADEEESKINYLNNNYTNSNVNNDNRINYAASSENNNKLSSDYVNNYSSEQQNFKSAVALGKNHYENDYGVDYQNKYGAAEEFRSDGNDFNNTYGDFRGNNRVLAAAAADKNNINSNENNFKSSFKNDNNNINNSNYNHNSNYNSVEAEKEMLSSFSPSEKTKSIFLYFSLSFFSL